MEMHELKQAELYSTLMKKRMLEAEQAEQAILEQPKLGEGNVDQFYT